MAAKKVTIRDLMDMKKRREKIVALSLYDYPTAYFADRAGVDMILVGDGSVGMTALGYNNTVPVTMDEMIIFCKAVARATDRALVMGDMPFMSYQNVDEALKNAGRFMKESGVDAIKLEGGKEICDRIQTISKAGIPVCGHIGLTPQSASLSGGYKVQGKNAESAMKILDDAIAIEKSGAFSIVIEFAATEIAQIVTEKLSIPVFGWGSGPYTDGIGLNIADVLGMSLGLKPSFAKEYAGLSKSMLDALTSYGKEIREKKFPEDKHVIHMDKIEYEKLIATKGD
ncbi:3-methyl-2-oxobutanoate hydroxymethyltransferase [[Eubacterium] cellulosolvens]